MDNKKILIAEKIEQTMKEYGLKEDDVKIGNSGQIKGYVMGLMDALKIVNSDKEENNNKREQKVVSTRTKNNNKNKEEK